MPGCLSISRKEATPGVIAFVLELQYTTGEKVTSTKDVRPDLSCKTSVTDVKVEAPIGSVHELRSRKMYTHTMSAKFITLNYSRMTSAKGGKLKERFDEF